MSLGRVNFLIIGLFTYVDTRHARFQVQQCRTFSSEAELRLSHSPETLLETIILAVDRRSCGWKIARSRLGRYPRYRR